MSKIGFIGAGAMATALARGIASTSSSTPPIWFHDPSSEAAQKFRASLESTATVNACASNQDLLNAVDTVLVAVKPQVLTATLERLSIPEATLMVSVVAGADLIRLQRISRHDRWVRVMPNTPCLIGEGAAAMSASDSVSPAQRQQVREYLGAMGKVIEVPERLLDAVTGLSGSGPAYVLTFVESLIDGGVLAGLPRDAARLLALQTIRGTLALLESTGDHPAVLRDQVTSPGGTTIAGLKALEESGFRDAVMSAVLAATERATEL